jgi:hypothetical protein
MIPPPRDAAIAHATRTWTTFVVDRNHQDRLSEWQAGTAGDGSPLVSFQVVGPDADEALAKFAGAPEFFRPLEVDDLRPSFDYSVPGRTVCVWRSGGVWVELWHPDTAQTAPVPASAVPEASPRGLLGGRLPFTRRHKETAA